MPDNPDARAALWQAIMRFARIPPSFAITINYPGAQDVEDAINALLASPVADAPSQEALDLGRKIAKRFMRLSNSFAEEEIAREIDRFAEDRVSRAEMSDE